MRSLPVLVVISACTATPERPVADAGPDVVALVGEAVTLGGDGEGASFEWTFGDGEAATGGPTATHTYAAPGHYTAFVEAVGEGGARALDQALVTVVWPALDPPPRVASPLAERDGELWVALPDLDAIAVVDVATKALVRHVETCDAPQTVHAGPDGVGWTCGDAVVLPGETVDFPPGSAPYGLAGDAQLAVTLPGTGQVALRRDGAWTTVDVAPDVRGVAVVGAAAWVSRYRSPDEAGELFRVTADAVDRFPLAIDPGPDSDTGARGLPNLLGRVVVRPDGRIAAVPGLKANIERGLYREGQPLTHETTVRADLRLVSLHPDEGPVGSELPRPEFDNRDHAAAVAFSPLGDWLYVAFSGARVVEVYDAYTLARAGGIPDVGLGLDGLWARDGELWVLAALSRELVVYDVIDAAAPHEVARIDLRGDLADLPDDVLRGKQIFHDAADPRMTSQGYVSCGSCHPGGSHDGRTWDFTDRGEGLRNTIDLRGHAGASPLHWSANFDEVQDFENDVRGPQDGDGFLDEADWAHASDPLGPSKAGLSADLDALAAYVASLDAFPASPWPGDDLGEQIFLSDEAGCVACHPPPDYTDGQWLAPGEPLLHDVGTLTDASGQRLGGDLPGLDTPTLRGLHATAPYLHDGRAGTLRDVLVTENPEDLHGKTSHLTDAELDALVVFLLGLD